MRTEGLGVANCPDGKPADLIIEEDGTTWLRLGSLGIRAWVNLEELRRPPAAPSVRNWHPRGPSTEELLRAGYMAAGVRDPGFTFGGVV
ncbi:hypothetical protein GALAXY_63 [Arthrobacter phage Galaxy]|uniref:Uncharacterized protein n=1 Tax=Arthrobacter phage Galaxy TaxID=1772326 RepID=A0A0U4JQU6_9CAUD|nr:hypothetical protein FDG93_gp63 [Arthrobacter phage Galaxy]ALY08907.1 hypothetical protein GALAXY_63 [Arthrobacter phage Galaxy]